MFSFIEKILPRHTRFALYLIPISIFSAFWGAKLVNTNASYFDFSLPIDKAIPYIPAFIFIYILAFVQWTLCYILLGHMGQKMCYTYCAGNFISKVICFLLFITVPTLITTRPVVTDGGFVNFFVKFIYSADTPPSNLFPSIHCLESWLCMRIVFKSKMPNVIKILNAVFTFAVFATVLLVKQHFFVDIPAGILVAEAGLLISKLCGADRLFFKFDAHFLKREEKDL